MRNRLHGLRTGLLWVAALSLLNTSGLVLAPANAADATSLRRTPIVEAIEKAAPAVVNIQGRKTIRSDQLEGGGADPFRQVNGMGTGIIIDSRGYILTNFHVVESVELIQVTLADKRTFQGRLVSHDPASDLALIKIGTAEPLPTIPIGVSSDLMLGEPVIAVGNAFGYEHTVTRGIISSLHREVQVSVTQEYHDLIQTDASINPGNSGGPLLNIDGQMIGINVAVRIGAQGIGFAIPVDETVEIAARLLNVERIERVVHGVVGRTEKIDTDRYFVVTRVRENTAAAQSGLQPRDVIAAVEQMPINRKLDFERALLGRRVGETLSLLVDRNGQRLTLELALSPATELADDFDRRTWNTCGMRLAPIDEKELRDLQVRYHGGLRITAVQSEGPASRQGIRPGDILVGMHVWETISKDNVLYILNHNDFEKFQPIKFYVLRGKETLFGHMQMYRTPVMQVSRRLDRGN